MGVALAGNCDGQMKVRIDYRVLAVLATYVDAPEVAIWKIYKNRVFCNWGKRAELNPAAGRPNLEVLDGGVQDPGGEAGPKPGGGGG